MVDGEWGELYHCPLTPKIWNRNAREKEEKKTKEVVVEKHGTRSRGEASVGGGSAQPSDTEVNVIVHRPHIKVGQITYLDHATNEEILRDAKQKERSIPIGERRIRMLGHILSTTTDRPAITLYNEQWKTLARETENNAMVCFEKRCTKNRDHLGSRK